MILITLPQFPSASQTHKVLAACLLPFVRHLSSHSTKHHEHQTPGPTCLNTRGLDAALYNEMHKLRQLSELEARLLRESRTDVAPSLAFGYAGASILGRRRE